jgi:hypothetical protein
MSDIPTEEIEALISKLPENQRENARKTFLPKAEDAELTKAKKRVEKVNVNPEVTYRDFIKETEGKPEYKDI